MIIEPCTRLRDAIIRDELSITLRLLKRFPELIDNRDVNNGWTNLHYASFNGNYLICSNLIKLIQLYKCDANEVKLSFEGESYLHVCCVPKAGGVENEQTLHLLLQNFHDQLIDIQDANGKTAMHLCCELDSSSCLKLLCEFEGDMNIVDNNGDTLLHLAMKMGNIKCIKVLLLNQHNLDLDIKNKQGFSVLDVANSFDTIKMYEFFKKQATITEQDISTPSMNNFKFSNNSTPNKSSSLPPLPSVTTNRRYSISSSPVAPTTNSSALSLSSSIDYSIVTRSRSTSIDNASPKMKKTISSNSMEDIKEEKRGILSSILIKAISK